jgi:hypothetical protein
MSFSQKDGTFSITAIEGHKKGQKEVFRASEKEDFDPGYKTTYLKGPGFIVGIAEGTGEPKLSIDASSSAHVQRVRSLAHNPQTGQKNRLTITHVFRRSGIGIMSWRFEECKMSGGGGYTTGDDGVKSKMEFMIERAFCSVNGGAFERVV